MVKRPTGFLFWYKILLLLAVSIIFLALGIAIAVWHNLNESARKVELDSKKILSDQVEMFLEKFVSERGDRLDAQLEQAQTIASFGAAYLSENSLHMDKNKLHGFMSTLYPRISHCSNIYYTTFSHLKQYYPVEKPDAVLPDADNFIQKPFFPKIIQFVYRTDEVKWSKVHNNPLGFSQDVVIDAIAPVIVNGIAKGFFGVSISVTKIISDFNHHQPIRGGYSFLLDTEYQLIGAPPHARIDLVPGNLIKENFIKIDRTGNPTLDQTLQRMVLGETNIKKVVIRNEPKYLAYDSLTNVNWRLGLVVPVRMATAASAQLVEVVNLSTRQVFKGILLWSIAFFIIVMVAGSMLARQLTHHIREMSKAAEKMSVGNFEGRVVINSQDELGKLARTFNTMAEKIQSMVVDFNNVNQKLKHKNRDLYQENQVRQQTEKSLRESERRYRLLVETMNEGMAIQEKQLITYVNRSFCEMLGYSEIELIGKNINTLYNQDNRKKLIKQLQLRKKGVNQSFEVELYKKNGDKVYSLISPSSSGFHGNIYQGSSAIFTDITDRKRVEEELRHLRNYLSNIIDSMPSLLIGVDANGMVTQWNKTAEQTTGINAKTAQGQLLATVYPQMTSEMDIVLKNSRKLEIRHERKQSRISETGTLYEDVTIYPLTSNGVEGAVIRVDNVTEKVRMEEMMIQSEKMLSVGGLAAGMAHEINNPLAGMMQSANVAINRLTNLDLPANQRAAEKAGISLEAIHSFMENRGIITMLDHIHASGSRAATIVSNMLSFARKSNSEFVKHNLGGLIQQTVELAGSDYDLKKKFDFRQIQIRYEFEEDIPLVPCESSKIQQVLLNILRNGAEAMQEGKNSAQNSDDEKSRFLIRLIHEKATQQVRIEIQDNGPGMKEEIRKRIFEPFYTTKQTDQGTGLGLSVSYFIITENHNGEMSVDSTLNEGSTFTIRLPIEPKTP